MQRLNVDKVQRPRRTSEFHEEPGTAVKRQSRVQGTARRGTTSTEHTPAHLGTGQKYTTRQHGSVSGSATRPRSGLPTPQKTPMQSARVLFTTEKQRGTSGVALHNDKKWIQDQTQRITEYLKNSYYPGCMAGISEDFFIRSNCLKQMSIKQFVSIINYFLHFIWGNRFTVGNNHVDDIVKILQKLNYPHQVNKSWLKTPNTTHSFGNVIVLFDFLMDFVPCTECEFPLLELQDHATQSEEIEPDLDFKATLLRNCQESFLMWDKQLDDDFEKVKRQTADLLVQKRCGIPGLDALDIELDRLYKKYENIQKQRPHVAPEDERECERLQEFVKGVHKELEQLREDYKKDKLTLQEMLSRKHTCDSEIARLEKAITTLQLAIREQIWSVKQRDACVEKLKLLRLELQSHERTVYELQHRDYRQQVQLSKTKKNVTEEIEYLNTILRDLTFTLAITDPQQQLLLSLNVDAQSVERLLPQLKALRNKTTHETNKTKQALKQYEVEIENLNYEVSVSIEPRMKAQEATLSSFLKRQQQLEEQIVKDFELLYARQQSCETKLSELESDIEDHQKKVKDRQIEIKQLEQECEEMLSKAEKEHSLAAEARRKFLEEYESNLNMCISRLNELEEHVMNHNGQELPISLGEEGHMVD